MKTFIVIFIASITIAACTPQKRLARLIDRHPELITYSTDTIYIDTVLIVPAKEVNISIPVNFDSIKLVSQGFTFDFIKNKAGDTIYINIVSPPDTVYLEKKIPYKKSSISPIIRESKTIEILQIILYIIIAIFIIYAFDKLIFERLKK